MMTTNRYRATGLQHVMAHQGRRFDWVAAQGGVSPSLIAHLLAGRRTVNASVAERVSTALGVPLFLLFELSDDIEKEAVSHNSQSLHPVP